MMRRREEGDCDKKMCWMPEQKKWRGEEDQLAQYEKRVEVREFCTMFESGERVTDVC
jgi:hypothetical protein